jgi:hypothetical protein
MHSRASAPHNMYVAADDQMSTRFIHRCVLLVKAAAFCAVMGIASGVLVLAMNFVAAQQGPHWEAVGALLYFLWWLPTVFFVILWLSHAYAVTLALSLASVYVASRAADRAQTLTNWSLMSLLCHLILVLVNSWAYPHLTHGSVIRSAGITIWPH